MSPEGLVLPSGHCATCLHDGRRFQHFHNAMRVTPSGDGCVVAFVLLRMPGVTDEAFENDAAHVARDLGALKALVEKRNT
jgi:hypothetical protein